MVLKFEKKAGKNVVKKENILKKIEKGKEL